MRSTVYLWLIFSFVGCSPAEDEREATLPFTQSHPYVILTDALRERIDRAQDYEAGQALFANVVESADEAFEDSESEEWDANLYGDYAFIAETNAFLIWYTNDCSRSTRVIEALSLIHI